MLDLDSFIQKMMEDKQYIPPLRVLFVGNDCQFNDFVKLYVTKILQLKPILLSDQKKQSLSDETPVDKQGSLAVKLINKNLRATISGVKN